MSLTQAFKSLFLSLLATALLASMSLHAQDDSDDDDLDTGDSTSVKVKLTRREKRELSYLIWHQGHRDSFSNNNKFMKRLEQKYSKGKIIGLELIVAAPTEIRIESRWGHSLMRFVDSESNIGDDVVLGFVAMLDSLQTKHMKGLMGGYPVFPVVKSMRLFNNQYVKSEDRPLDRHVMVTSVSAREQAIKRTLEMWQFFVEHDRKAYHNATTQYRRKALKRAQKRWGQEAKVEELKHPESDELIGFLISKKDDEKEYETVAIRYQPVGHPALGGYTFLSNNCAGALVRFLEHAGLPHRERMGFAGRIPVKLPVYFDDSLLTPFPALKGMGLVDLKQALTKLFKLKNMEKLNEDANWPKDAATLIAGKYDLKGQMLILDALDMVVPNRVRDELLVNFPPVADRPSYNEIYHLVSLPRELYSACSDRACIGDLNKAAELVWSPAELDGKKAKVRSYLQKLGDKKVKKILLQDEEYQNHLDLWSNL